MVLVCCLVCVWYVCVFSMCFNMLCGVCFGVFQCVFGVLLVGVWCVFSLFLMCFNVLLVCF